MTDRLSWGSAAFGIVVGLGIGLGIGVRFHDDLSNWTRSDCDVVADRWLDCKVYEDGPLSPDGYRAVRAAVVASCTTELDSPEVCATCVENSVSPTSPCGLLACSQVCPW